MGVDLGRADIRMAQQELDAAQIRPALQQVSREAVTQHVRRQAIPPNSYPPPRGLEDEEEGLSRHRTAARRYEQVGALPPREQSATRGGEILAVSLACRGADGNDSLAVALPPNHHVLSLGVHLAQLERDQLAHTQPSAVRHL